jgi:ribosomal protein S18 acetylase RimI-like enzyme
MHRQSGHHLTPRDEGRLSHASSPGKTVGAGTAAVPGIAPQYAPFRMCWAVPLRVKDRAMSASLCTDACAQAARPVPLAHLTARRIAEHDLGFLRGLYASTRADEMAATHWPQDAQRRFLAQQFELQHRHYQAHFAGAEFLLLLRKGQPIGRLYWHAKGQGGEATLVEISLLPAYRGRGVGSALLSVLAAQADIAGQPISLHVDPANPARRLYERFGFAAIAAPGGYLRMMRRPRARVPGLEKPWLLADLLQPAPDSARPAPVQ